MGIAYGAVHDPGAETSALGMGIHDHTFSSSCKRVFTTSLSRAAVKRNISFVDAAVDAGGRTEHDDGFALLVDEASTGPQLLGPALANTRVESQLPPWVRDVAEGGRVEPHQVRGRL